MKEGENKDFNLTFNPKSKDKKGLREKFLNIYNNLPETERPHIIVIVNKEPYSWRRVYDEVINDTKLSKEMLKKMQILEIL